MFRFALIFAACGVLATPAVAQEATPAPETQPVVVIPRTPPSAEQTRLAERYLRLVQTEQMGKFITEMIDQQMAGDGQSGADERDFMRRQGAPAIRRMIESVMRQLAPVVAEIHTEAELRALIAFYETPLGQSIALKQLELGVRQEQLMMPALNEMMTSLMTKYCAEFDCGTGATPQASKPRG